jgi:hypothetical protein
MSCLKRMEANDHKHKYVFSKQMAPNGNDPLESNIFLASKTIQTIEHLQHYTEY